jgi:hypothetical protein
MESLTLTTGNIFIDLLLAGLLGMLIYIFLVKIPAIQQRAEKANTEVSFGTFFGKDYPSLIGSFLVVIVYIFVVDEIQTYSETLATFKKLLGVFIGYCGSSVLLRAFGRTEKLLLKVIDRKTDLADGKLPPQENQ